VLGEIAKIRLNKGEVDEALKLHKERPQVFDELGDIDSKAATLWDLAQIEVKRKSVQTASDYLTESYGLFLKLDRLDGICFVGLLLGPLLCGDGNTEEGLNILQRSRDGFRKLGWKELAAQAEALIEKVGGGGVPKVR